MILNHIVAFTLLLLTGWYSYNLFLESSCTFRFYSYSFTQITQSLHHKKKMENSIICKKPVSFSKKATLRTSHYDQQKLNIRLNGSLRGRN